MQRFTDTERAADADLNLARSVADTLLSLSFPSFRFLRISAEQGIVTLSGEVHTYYERQLAQSWTRRVHGVVQVIDEVTVAGPSSLNLAGRRAESARDDRLSQRVAVRRVLRQSRLTA